MDEGISFIVRIRNEEDVLEESIRSLFPIRVPHEILLILHRCTDSSKQIADKLALENSKIRVLEYTTPISRPGYETLCTDKDSPHSIMTYYTWCYNQARYPWLFKWDADFISTQELTEYINGCGWCRDTTKSHELFIHADSPDGHRNTERYIVSGQFTFEKYWFWEFIDVKPPIMKINTGVVMKHQSSLTKKKTYWDESPWFLDRAYLKENPEHYDEAIKILNRYTNLVKLCGQEINGQARASNPDSEAIFTSVVEKKNQLYTYDIHSAL